MVNFLLVRFLIFQKIQQFENKQPPLFLYNIFVQKRVLIFEHIQYFKITFIIFQKFDISKYFENITKYFTYITVCKTLYKIMLL